MEKNAIVIMNIVGFPQIVPVENFSDDNIKQALSKKLKVDVENLECLTVNNPMIYGVKELVPSLLGVLGSVQPWYGENPARHFHYIHIINAIQ